MITWKHFVNAVEEEFRFLNEEFGFSVISRIEPFVVFGAASVRVNIYCDVHRHAELDLGIERVIDVGKRVPFFRIYEFGNIQGISLLPRTGPFLESDKQLAVELQRLASELKQCCSDALRGDLRVFELIERNRD